MRRLAPLLGFLSMFGAFSIDTIFPAFPQIGAQFGAGTLAMQQTISAYLMAYAGMSLWHGALSDAFGRRRVIMVGISIFVLASIGCAMSTSLPMLVSFRVLQGLSAGVGLIVGRAVIRDVFDGADAQRLMSQVSMIFGIAPAVAPIIGGWLLGWHRWPAIFWFLALFGVLLLVSVMLWLPETHPRERWRSIKPRSLWRTYATILSNAEFRRLSLSSAFNFGALFLLISSAPALVLEHFRLGPQQFGWFFIPMIAGMMTGAFLSGRLAGRMDGKRQVGIGFGLNVTGAALLFAYALWADHLQIPQGMLPVMAMSFGIALVMPIITLMCLDIFPDLRGAASSVQAFVGLAMNAVIAGVVSPMLSGRDHLLAAGAFVMAALGWAVWWLAIRHGSKVPDPPAHAENYEPLDEL